MCEINQGMHIVRLKFFFTIILGWYGLGLASQSIEISPDINIKNDFAYYIVACEGGKVALLRDKSFKLVMQVLDAQFNWSSEISIDITGKKWRIIEICKDPRGVGIFYYTKLENDGVFIYANYDLGGQRIREHILYENSNIQTLNPFRIQQSENETWFALGFTTNPSKKNLLLYNRKEDSVYANVVLNEILNYKEGSVSEMEISNDGGAFFLGVQKSSISNKKKVLYQLTQIANSGSIVAQKEFDLGEYEWYNGIMAYNNVHRELVLAGLFSEKSSETPIGYFNMKWKEPDHHSIISFQKFSPEMLLEWTGKTKKMASQTSNLNTKYVSFDLQGGFQIFFESSKELSRRPYFSSSSDPGTAAYSRWVDYYYDDVIIACFDQESKLSWDKVLHKKQYSQDDDAVFSSFYLFKNSAFLRLIFNDEIRNEGTVSEYIVRPDGTFIRKSLLNTSKKNLNLRFIDAITINASSLMVPSESNGKLNLVQIHL